MRLLATGRGFVQPEIMYGAYKKEETKAHKLTCVKAPMRMNAHGKSAKNLEDHIFVTKR